MNVQKQSSLQDLTNALQGQWESTSDYVSLGKVRIWFRNAPKDLPKTEVAIERL